MATGVAAHGDKGKVVRMPLGYDLEYSSRGRRMSSVRPPPAESRGGRARRGQRRGGGGGAAAGLAGYGVVAFHARMIRTVMSLCALPWFAACGGDAHAAPPDEELLAAHPGGEIFTTIERIDSQVGEELPRFLFGDGVQVARGVSVPTGAVNPDGGKPVHRWGLWHYYHVDSANVGDRSTWGHLAQRGEFRDNTRVGQWPEVRAAPALTLREEPFDVEEARRVLQEADRRFRVRGA